MNRVVNSRIKFRDEVDYYVLQHPGKEEIRVSEPFFDADYYLASNPDVAETLVDPLVHFLTVGWVEGRNPSLDFDVRYYLENNQDVREQRLHPFLHYCRSGRLESWRSVATVAEAAIARAFAKNDKLMQSVAEAKALDPMVALPDIPRKVNIPPAIHRQVADAAEQLREMFAGRSFEHVVLVPHIRMSGSARVATVLARALAGLVDSKTVAVVSTDTSDDEYRHWLPDGCEFHDISQIVQSAPESHRPNLLFDFLRGVEARTVYNVNSGLVWRTSKIYGRQIKQEFRVMTYLFTWDESVSGARVGYPIQWLRDTCDYHDVILTDNEALSTDVRQRFGYGQDDGCEVVTLYTPAEKAAPAQLRREAGSDTPIFLWAGRFDRQKRVDILIEIAKRRPDAIFHVYGKPVLDAGSWDESKFPPNCVLKGTFQSFEDVLQSETFAGFVYTAQWDGIPTILLDAAASGLPIIAPDVGGVGELIDGQTGYLISNFDDIDAYEDAMNRVIQDPSEAIARAERLRERLARDFSDARYMETLKRVVLNDHA
ncbi:glycosyltransferase family 4 protein [Jiella mangrovi]|uniref:Glycosyltransferase family 4 protein n=1 Tax=Jiella mangrovi TaxID=2821407 RepID=A0ABS4BIP5_9HYPH|nr:glycosyltransferase family 4 protein [Jiella mangrovi]MBP0616041.1 glycosyltransferase family 4 protein [Jiella mangrovi]